MSDEDASVMDAESQPTAGSATAPDAAAERRAILASLGKLAALTPPAMVTLLLTTRPSAASVGGAPPDPV